MGENHYILREWKKVCILKALRREQWILYTTVMEVPWRRQQLDWSLKGWDFHETVHHVDIPTKGDLNCHTEQKLQTGGPWAKSFCFVLFRFEELEHICLVNDTAHHTLLYWTILALYVKLPRGHCKHLSL